MNNDDDDYHREDMNSSSDYTSSGIDSDTEDRLQSLLHCTSLPILKSLAQPHLSPPLPSFPTPDPISTTNTTTITTPHHQFLTTPASTDNDADSKYRNTVLTPSSKHVRTYQIDSDSDFGSDTTVRPLTYITTSAVFHTPDVNSDLDSMEPPRPLIFSDLDTLSANIDAHRPSVLSHTLSNKSNHSMDKQRNRYFQSPSTDHPAYPTIDLLDPKTLYSKLMANNPPHTLFEDIPCGRCLELHPDNVSRMMEQRCWDTKCDHCLCKYGHDDADCPLRILQECYLCRSTTHTPIDCPQPICEQCPGINEHIKSRCPRNVVTIVAVSNEMAEAVPKPVKSCPICGVHHFILDCPHYDPHLDFNPYMCGLPLSECSITLAQSDPNPRRQTDDYIDPILTLQIRHTRSKQRYSRDRSPYRTKSPSHSYRPTSKRPKYSLSSVNRSSPTKTISSSNWNKFRQQQQNQHSPRRKDELDDHHIRVDSYRSRSMTQQLQQQAYPRGFRQLQKKGEPSYSGGYNY